MRDSKGLRGHGRRGGRNHGNGQDLRLTEGLSGLERRDVTSDQPSVSLELVCEVPGSQVERKAGHVEHTVGQRMVRGRDSCCRGSLTFCCPIRIKCWTETKEKTHQRHPASLEGTHRHDHFCALVVKKLMESGV